MTDSVEVCISPSCPESLANVLSTCGIRAFDTLRVLQRCPDGTGEVKLCQAAGSLFVQKIYLKQKLSRARAAQIRREIEVHGSLSHPNVVPLLVVWETDTMYCLVQAYMDGGDCFDMVYNQPAEGGKYKAGGVTEAKSVKIAHAMLQALDYLHTQGLIHRDLKLENIFCQSQGQYVLGDFGFSIAGTRERPSTRLGTMQMMAPEILSGSRRSRNPGAGPREEGTYGPEVDIWALGVVVHELLTGAAPFEARDYAEMAKVVERGFRVPKGISQDAADFLTRALDTDSRKRATAAELLRHPWIARRGKEGLARRSRSRLALGESAKSSGSLTPPLGQTSEDPGTSPILYEQKGSGKGSSKSGQASGLTRVSSNTSLAKLSAADDSSARASPVRLPTVSTSSSGTLDRVGASYVVSTGSGAGAGAGGQTSRKNLLNMGAPGFLSSTVECDESLESYSPVPANRKGQSGQALGSTAALSPTPLVSNSGGGPAPAAAPSVDKRAAFSRSKGQNRSKKLLTAFTALFGRGTKKEAEASPTPRHVPNPPPLFAPTAPAPPSLRTPFAAGPPAPAALQARPQVSPSPAIRAAQPAQSELQSSSLGARRGATFSTGPGTGAPLPSIGAPSAPGARAPAASNMTAGQKGRQSLGATRGGQPGYKSMNNIDVDRVRGSENGQQAQPRVAYDERRVGGASMPNFVNLPVGVTVSPGAAARKQTGAADPATPPDARAPVSSPAFGTLSIFSTVAAGSSGLDAEMQASLVAGLYRGPPISPAAVPSKQAQDSYAYGSLVPSPSPQNRISLTGAAQPPGSQPRHTSISGAISLPLPPTSQIALSPSPAPSTLFKSGNPSRRSQGLTGSGPYSSRSPADSSLGRAPGAAATAAASSPFPLPSKSLGAGGSVQTAPASVAAIPTAVGAYPSPRLGPSRLAAETGGGSKMGLRENSEGTSYTVHAARSQSPSPLRPPPARSVAQLITTANRPYRG